MEPKPPVWAPPVAGMIWGVAALGVVMIFMLVTPGSSNFDTGIGIPITVLVVGVIGFFVTKRQWAAFDKARDEWEKRNAPR